MSKKRIFLNIVATYSQSIVTMIIGLFTVRWAYLALGKERYGLFAAVGAIFGFAGILGSVMSNSNSRFYAIAIGEGRRLGAEHGRRELKAWLNTALSVHLALGAAICLVVWPAGEFLVRNRLTIPVEHIQSAVAVFRISVVALFVNFANGPVLALYTAKQYIFVRNMISGLEALLMGLEAWWLLHFSGNRIVGHSLATAAVHFSLLLLTLALAFRMFPEARIDFRLWYDRRRLKKLFSYASFTIFGSLGAFFSGPMVQLVVNAFFGVGANAVIGVGRRFASKLEHVAEAITSAVFPEVSTRIGAEDRHGAERMAVMVSFFSCLPTCLIAVPLLFWVDPFLRILLVSPPEGSSTVVFILVANSFLLRITSGYQMMVHASGKIKTYQMTLGTLNMSCALVLWILFRSGIPFLVSLGIAWLLPRAVLSAARVAFAKRLLGVDVALFFRMTLVPLALCVSFSLVFCGGVRALLGTSVWWSAPATLLNASLLLAAVWRFYPGELVRELPRKLLARLRRMRLGSTIATGK